MSNISNKKKKGVIRTGLLSLLLVVFILLGLYFKFFFDIHLGWALKRSMTSANCAEVNLKSIKTNFRNLTLKLRELELTNYSTPQKNLVKVGELDFQLNWDAALRLKILIKDASIKGLEFNSLRQKIGKTYESCKKKNEGEVAFSKKIQEQKDKLLKDNVLASIIKILKDDGNIVERFKKIKIDLETQRKITEIREQLVEKKKAWNLEINKLSDTSRIKGLVDQAKGLKTSKDPIFMAGQLKKLLSLKSKAESEILDYQRGARNIKNDISSLKNIKSEIEESIAKDKESVRQYLNLPNLNITEISQEVFSDYAKALVRPYMVYWNRVQRYLPQKNVEDTDLELKPHERAKGVTVHYPVTKGYPKVWLKKLNIEAMAYLNNSEKGSVGVKGEMLDFSSDERITKKPMLFKVFGDLPQEKIKGIDVSGKVFKDYDQNMYKADLEGAIKSFPIKEAKLTQFKGFKLVLKDAKATTKFSGVLGEEKGKLKLTTIFDDADWLIETDKDKVTKILSGILSDIPQVNLKTLFGGAYLKPDLKISSNFDMKFKKGIGQFLNKKVFEAKEKVHSFVEDKVAEQKKSLFNQLGKDQKELLAPLLKMDLSMKSFQNTFTNLKKDFEAQQKSKAKSKIKNEVNKGLNKLKKKVKLPF